VYQENILMSFLLFEIPNYNAEEVLLLKRMFLFAPPCFREMFNTLVFCVITMKYDATWRKVGVNIF